MKSSMYVIKWIAIIMLVLLGFEISIWGFQVENVWKVCKLIGIDSFNATVTVKYQVYGADLGIMIDAATKTYFVFGDTFGQGRPSIWYGPKGTLWRSNVLAISTNKDFWNGAKIDCFISQPSKSRYKTMNKGSSLMLTAGPYMDQWILVNESPKYLINAPGDNWCQEVHIIKNNAEQNTFGGLVVWRNKENWLLWGQLPGKRMEGSGVVNNTFTGTFVSISKIYDYLKLEKNGYIYNFYYSSDGKSWILAGSYTDFTKALDGKIKVGLLEKNWGHNSFTMVYTEYRLNNSTISFDDPKWEFVDPVRRYAKEVLRSSHGRNGEITVIPTGGIYDPANKSIYLFYMSIKNWGAPGHWDVNYSGLAVSKDNEKNWEKLKDVTWPGTSNFAQISICRANESPKYHNSSDVYLFGIPGGRFGGVKLMKTTITHLQDPHTYLYYYGIDENGVPRWGTNIKKAVQIIEPPVGENSVMYDKYLGLWIITYLNEYTHNIEIRSAKEPWGPWSSAQTLVSASNFPALYGPFMNPKYILDNGRIIYFTMSQWGPYSVFLMGAEFKKVQKDNGFKGK